MWETVERALEAGAEKMQQYEGYVNQEVVEKAHRHGVKVGVYIGVRKKKYSKKCTNITIWAWSIS